MEFEESEKQKDKQKWKMISFHKSSKRLPKREEPPREFACPISGLLMGDPVVVSSGHTFERACVDACRILGFLPVLIDGTVPIFSSVIPNLALKAAIINWCKTNSRPPPKALEFFTAEKIVSTKMGTVTPTRNRRQFYPSSDESLDTTVSTPPQESMPHPRTCSSSSSEMENVNLEETNEEGEFLTKFHSQREFDIEEALVSLRTTTRTDSGPRINLCTPRILSALRDLCLSKYTSIQVNSVACLVNLSLATPNKVKILRSGIVPSLINVLKGGFPEAQEHAAGAFFSLALDGETKTAIGVLGALPPLLYLLRSHSYRARRESAMALYHLSLSQSNKMKLIRLGSIPILLGMLKVSQLKSEILLILCNLGSCSDGRSAMLDAGTVDVMVEIVRSAVECELIKERSLFLLHSMSLGGMRFKGLAKAAGAGEVLLQLGSFGGEKTREKVKRMLKIMEMEGAVVEEEQGCSWEELLES